MVVKLHYFIHHPFQRLDLRGHKVRNLNASGLNLAQNLEFVYLRDNLLSTLEGIEILKRVKVLDLSFNEFKGPGFEPLENCQALQQLYLAGNQITSLVNIPQLPNLEFLSVAQNKLKSLSMAGQPRLQVLAASKNKITTLKGFPHLPSLELLNIIYAHYCILRCGHISFGELPQVEMVALTGKAIEGDVLTAVEVIPKSETQRNVWSKYKKEVKYQWFCSTVTGDGSFELLPAQHSCSYKLRLEDIGRRFRCECIVTDVFGRLSELAYAETDAVLPGIPRINKLEIEGRGFHTNLYAVRGIYSGGKEGKSRIQWLRSMIGSPDLISIPGEAGRMYEANVDDVGYRLVAIYTPVRDDGVEGQPVSASTEPIAVEPDVFKEVKQKIELGSVKFEVWWRCFEHTSHVLELF